MSRTVDDDIVIERRYVPKASITKEWHAALRNKLEPFLRDPGLISCYVRLNSDPDVHRQFKDLGAFFSFVAEHWSEVLESEIWSSDTVLVRIVCDHARQGVLLSSRAGNDAAAEQTIREIESTLELQAAARQPYRYRRASLEYEIKNWRGDSFAAAVREIANLLGGRPFLREAYVKIFNGNIETLTPFVDLDGFLQQVGTRTGAYGETAILMEGRDNAVGLRVNSEHTRLRIRTSFDLPALDQLINAFTDNLGLVQVKALDSGSDVGAASPSQRPEKPLLKYGIPVLVAAVTAASVSGFVSLKKAVFPDYKVFISTPPTTNGTADITGPLQVSWYLKPDGASLRGIVKDVPATIRIFPAGQPVQTFPGKMPNQTLTLAPGDYIVQVETPDTEPAQITVRVKPRK